MKPGHPFFTEEFDRLRAEQRRALRMLPDALLRHVSPHFFGEDAPQKPKISEGDRTGLLENQLRQLARGLGEEVEQYGNQADISKRLFAFIDENQPNILVRGGFYPFDDILTQMRQETKKDFSSGMEFGAQILCFAVTLIWADELAGDYRDPRLPSRPPAPGGASP